MKNTIQLLMYILIGALMLTSCEKDPNKQIAQLEGYWNIEEVKLPDGNTKEFPFSNHMDYFEINGNKGMKHRVSPRYDGTFVNYGSPVPFKWEAIDGTLTLNFAEGDNAYQQTLESVTEEELVLLHENGTTYTYTSYKTDEEQ
ncbi:MAG: lipocalin family protein [Nonlabens sp.]